MPRPKRRDDRSAFALVIVLAFLVLLAGVGVAFFSRAALQRQVSQVSASRVQTEMLGAAAVNAMVDDFRREIAAGSVGGGIPVYTNKTGEVSKVYYPTAPTNMVPQRVGVASNELANVVKRSAAGEAFYDGGPSRAAGPSTVDTNVGYGGRFVTAARWNRALLLPKKDSNSTTDWTPSENFTAPDWVLVTRGGSSPTAWSKDLCWTATNSNSVVGRYAYVVYDEGGLLDANSAGYPTGSGSGSSLATNVAYKGALAFADLTQIPGMTADAANALVDWRNAATMSGGATGYVSYVLRNLGGFLRAGNTAVGAGGTTDRQFVSRQQLIEFFNTRLGASNNAELQGALQYLGTFSRDINQPSFFKTQSVSNNMPGYVSNGPKLLARASGGNKETSDLGVNPPFLNVRVTTKKEGGRNDGSDLVEGEPLVKERFALNRLAWITYKGPSANNMSDPVVEQAITSLGGKAGDANDPIRAFVARGTAANIEKYFGLRWETGHWTYSAGKPGGGGAVSIYNLGEITGREANFFELLKATINVGSIAKSSVATLSATAKGIIKPWNDQGSSDASVNDAIMQIGANIIDQFDADGYPTQIYFNYNMSQYPPGDFCGVENMPYIYRVHPTVMTAVEPTFAATNRDGTAISLANAQAISNAIYSETKYWNSGVANYFPGIRSNSYPAGNGVSNVTSTGLGAVMLVPEIWNPHDWDASNPSKSTGIAAPTKFRISASQSSWGLFCNTNIILIAQEDDFYTSTKIQVTRTKGYTDWGFPVSGEQRTINAANTEMTFQIDGSSTKGAQLFREPTVLCRQGFPDGSSLTSPALANPSTTLLGRIAGLKVSPNVFVDGGIISKKGAPGTNGPPVAGRGYIGFYLGSIPLLWKPTDSETMPRAQYVRHFTVTQGTDIALTLECLGPDGQWVTYDRKVLTLGDPGYEASPRGSVRSGHFASPCWSQWSGFLQPHYEADTQFFVVDPRTSRFGFQVTSGVNFGGDVQSWTGTLPTNSFPPFSLGFTNGTMNGYSSWLNRDNGVMGSLRDGWAMGARLNGCWANISTPMPFTAAMGFTPANLGNNETFRPGMLSQNTPLGAYSLRLGGDGEAIGPVINPVLGKPTFYADPDNIVRRAMGGWADLGTTSRSGAASTGWSNYYAELLGLPMRRAHKWDPATAGLVKTDVLGNRDVPGDQYPAQAQSRPMILNRPFKSVGELGYTFAGTPWKNLNFDMPESGDSGLLDVFCLTETTDPDKITGGKVNLNTRQKPVVKAIIAGAYKDELGVTTSQSTAKLADLLSERLVARTTGYTNGVSLSGTNTGPLRNIGDLVGRWVTGKNASNPVSKVPPFGPTSYEGYSSDVFMPELFANATKRTQNSDASQDDPAADIVADKTVGRRRAAPIRALAAAGQTRVWNLMLDLVVQAGRYPGSASELTQFLVEGEQRLWVHLAIDRMTGKVLDKQVEVVTE